ncbi:hypothetical protein B0H14DRAFT_3591193 [Mycena olivaceomarginata]|nr:hypothetical protein B0H14DRAFT_3591193 [Mycena olivaceomarginata]
MVAIPISAGGPSSTGARHQPPSAAARSCPRIAKFIFLVSFFDATVTNLPLAFPGRGQTCLCGRSKKDFPADDRYTRARSPIALSAGFGVGTCVIVYSWSPSFTTAPLAFPHRRPADSPRPHLPCNGSVQAPTWNPSRPIENLRDVHVISRQSVVYTVQLSHKYASSPPTACLTLYACVQCNPPRIPASKPSRATPRSSRRHGTAFDFNVLTFKHHKTSIPTTVAHSNIPVQDGKKIPLTQFTAYFGRRLGWWQVTSDGAAKFQEERRL